MWASPSPTGSVPNTFDLSDYQFNVPNTFVSTLSKNRTRHQPCWHVNHRLSSLPNSENTISVVLSHSAYGIAWEQPTQTNVPVLWGCPTGAGDISTASSEQGRGARFIT